MYEIIITKTSQKFIVKQNSDTKARIEDAFENIKQNPKTHTNVKSLKGPLVGYYRYRVGDIRIIYRIDETKEQILVVGIGYRGDIYKE